jgi:hypothetical protein
MRITKGTPPALALLLAGCASVNHAQIAIDPMVQADAPVQVVSITPDGDNLLAKVTVKNATDRPIDNFDVAWEAFRPVNCAASGPAPEIRRMAGGGQSAHAEVRGTGTLPPGNTWGARVLNPHEQTEITALSLSRGWLLKMAKDFDAKKVRVQVGINYMNYPPEPGATYHNGPDWRSIAWEKAGNLFDEDTTKQACG